MPERRAGGGPDRNGAAGPGDGDPAPPGHGAPASPEAAAALLRTCRPDVSAEPRLLAEGDFYTAWLLDDERVVRFPKHGEAAAALRREACLLPRVATALRVPVPACEFVPCPEAGGGISLHRRVPGTPLTPGRWRALGDDDKLRLPREVGSTLDALHRIDPDAVDDCGLETSDPRGRVEGLRARLDSALLPDRLRNGLRKAFDRYLAEAAAWAYEPAILHGDLSPGHVLVEAGAGAVESDGEMRLTGVIDWADAFVGDPARDFIFLYEDWGTDFLDLALEAYGREPAQRLRPRILLLYLADQLAWTLERDGGDRSGIAHGVAMLRAGLRDFRREAGR